MASNRRSKSASRSQHIEVHDNDVLNGRGVKIAQHSGNLRFRSLIKQYYDPNYCETFSSMEKKALTWKVIDHMKKKLKPPGRFLKKLGQDGPWIELTKKETEKKTKQALRDCSRPDREGYAKQVKAPEDVDKADNERKRSGLSLQEFARKQVNDQPKRRKILDTNNPKPTSTSCAASRTSRRSSQRGSAFSGTVNIIADSRTTAPLEPPYQQQSMEAATAVTSTASWAAPSAGNATPAVRPHVGPTPVTETPNHTVYSYLPENGHGIHPINHGSQSNINAQPLASYHNHYPTRDNFVDRHTEVAQSESRFPSPIVRSPIVSSVSLSNTNVFEEQHPFLEEWNTGHPRQNLFSEDPLDSMAASASDSLANHGTGVDDFMLGFPVTNDVADVPDNHDLKF